MAITKNPKRNINDIEEKDVEAFISGADRTSSSTKKENKKPIMIRIDPEILDRIERSARRLGLSRSSFLVLSAVEKLERME